LRPHEIALIKAKLRVAFGSQFSALDFQAAVRDLQRGFPLEIELPGGAEDSPEGPDLLRFTRTDSGNGERIVAL
jgi:hypothetical protein